jgi:hypothetical protein
MAKGLAFFFRNPHYLNCEFGLQVLELFMTVHMLVDSHICISVQQVPLLGGAMCACTWHFFYNSESLEVRYCFPEVKTLCVILRLANPGISKGLFP